MGGKDESLIGVNLAAFGNKPCESLALEIGHMCEEQRELVPRIAVRRLNRFFVHDHSSKVESVFILSGREEQPYRNLGHFLGSVSSKVIFAGVGRAGECPAEPLVTSECLFRSQTSYASTSGRSSLARASSEFVKHALKERRRTR